MSNRLVRHHAAPGHKRGASSHDEQRDAHRAGAQAERHHDHQRAHTLKPKQIE
jgi:hypothetical protein